MEDQFKTGGEAQFNMSLDTLQRMSNLIKAVHSMRSIGNTQQEAKELNSLSKEVKPHIKGKEESLADKTKLDEFRKRLRIIYLGRGKTRESLTNQMEIRLDEWMDFIMEMMVKYKLLMAQSDDPRHLFR